MADGEGVRAALNDVARDADPLHLHSNGLIIEPGTFAAARPVCLTLYGTEIWHYKKRRGVDAFAMAYRGAAHITFYSQRLMERAKAEGLDRDDLTVVYPPVAESFIPADPDRRLAFRRELGIEERLVVLNVKRLHAGRTALPARRSAHRASTDVRRSSAHAPAKT